MWVAIGIALALVLLMSMRLALVVGYDGEGFSLLAWAGPLRIRILPRPLKGDRPPKKVKEKPEKVKEKGGTMEKLRAGLKIAGPIFSQVKRRLKISELTLHYTAGMEDAAMTALAYGGAHAAVSQILPLIRYHFRVGKQDIQIHSDFSSGENLVFLRVRISISVWGAIRLGIFTLGKLRESGLIQIRKGAVKHGQASQQ